MNKNQMSFLEPIIKEVIDRKYNTKVNAPIYEPKNKRPFIQLLIDERKCKKLIQEIESSSVSDEEKSFLVKSAYRHSVFNFRMIADYYAHASPEMQELMEKSALVIIDFDKAIEYGFAVLSDEIAEQYIEDSKDE